jgi:hypothetical protein
MNKHGTQFSAVLLGLGLLGSVAACGGGTQDSPSRSGKSAAPNTTHSSNSNPQGSGSNPSGGNGSANGAAGNSFGSAGSSAPQTVSDMTTDDGNCAESSSFKKEGCPCHNGDTAACWTGPAADRNVGMCHDGLQICSISGDNEFATWGPCMGEKLDCGVPDAGTPPPPPPPNEDCTCVPGAVIQCSEDCSVNIVCSLTASKTCLPDGTWSVCHEDTSVMLDVPGVQCRNMLHGCLDVLNPDMPGQNELYVGDCSKQFKCGHAPPPPDTPPEDPPPPDPMPE